MTDLINTLEAPGEFDALATLRPGEPYFLLVGRDRLAPKIIDDWADHNRHRALAKYAEGSEEQARELRKSTQAESIAEAMREYKRGSIVERIKEVAAPILGYTGHKVDAATAARDAEQSTRIRVAAKLNNIVAELSDMTDDLANLEGGLNIDPEISWLKKVAERVTPARPIGGNT